MNKGVIVDTSAWQFAFSKKRPLPDFAVPIADAVRRLHLAGAAWIHPVVAGEVLLGGVDPIDAFEGLPWLDTSTTSDRDVLDWLITRPRGSVRGVGWADCQIVYAAVTLDMPLITGDADQEALWKAAQQAI